VSWAELYVDPPARGSWNMSVDQALLEHCEATGRPVVRLYQWSPATLSLGYFQKYDERALHSASVGLDLVRRATGGGAIVHDRELTYSLCMPSEERWSQENRRLYDSVHEAILATLREFGITAELYSAAGTSGHASGGERPATESQLAGCGARSSTDAAPFLCFQRRAVGDVIFQGHKVGGSAQRRGKQALLQHGSILLQKSDFAPELPGLEELSGISLNSGSFSQILLGQLARELNLLFESVTLLEPLRRRAEEIESATFAAPTWNRNR
jgi:lipoate-protein ligase A